MEARGKRHQLWSILLTLVANAYNMPVATRGVSTYIVSCLAEYFQDIGLNVSMLIMHHVGLKHFQKFLAVL